MISSLFSLLTTGYMERDLANKLALKNMHNSNFKQFAFFKAKGENFNFGWGSIQEWGCI